MLFPQQFPSLTIPTGAGPGQQRITINAGNDGAIKVYDANGVLVDEIAPGVGIVAGASGGPQVILGTNNTAGVIALPSGSPVERTDASIVSDVGNKGLPSEYATLQINGPTVIGATDGTQIQLNSQDNDGSSNANLQLRAGTASFLMDKTSTSINVPTFSVNGVAVFGNVAVGSVVITPTAANTPTKATVNYTQLTGSAAHGFVTAQTSFPGTVVTGVSVNNITPTSADIWVTRTNTTATGVYYVIWYT